MPSILRIEKTSNYSIISNIHVQDKNLSWKAKGLMNYLLSLPNDWQIYIEHLKNQSTDGRESTSSGIKELMENGYITRDYKRDDSGKFSGYAYVVRESPTKPANNDFAENPITENPISVKPISEKPTLLKTDSIHHSVKQITKEQQQQKPNPPIEQTDVNVVVVPQIEFEKQQVTLLLELVPEKHQQPMIKKCLSKSLKSHTPDELKAAILYTNKHSTGDTEKYRSYLGLSLKNGWSDGVLESIEQTNKLLAETEKVKAAAEKLRIDKERAEIAEMEKNKAHRQYKNKLLKSVDLNALDTFIESEYWDKVPSLFQTKWRQGDRGIIREMNIESFYKSNQKE